MKIYPSINPNQTYPRLLAVVHVKDTSYNGKPIHRIYTEDTKHKPIMMKNITPAKFAHHIMNDVGKECVIEMVAYYQGHKIRFIYDNDYVVDNAAILAARGYGQFVSLPHSSTYYAIRKMGVFCPGELLYGGDEREHYDSMIMWG